MTNKPMLSVERELLERAASAIEKHHGSLQWVIASELRALLDKQAECRCKRYGKDNPHWPCPVHAEPAAQHQGVPPLIATLHENGELITAQATIAQQAKLIELLKGQGEPVAICRLWNEGGSGELTSVEFIGEPCADGTLLYADQPAPVAVVLPERESFDIDDWAGSFCQEALQGGISQHVFERCIRTTIQRALTEVARLNGVKP